MRLFDSFSNCMSRTQTSLSKINVLARSLDKKQITSMKQLNDLKKTRDELKAELKKTLEELDDLGDIYSIYEVEIGGVNLEFFGKEKE